MIFIKKLPLENWGLKLTSIFLALVLWLFVRGDPGAERVITVPLEVRIPSAMEITSERPTSVDVTVRGATTNTWFGQSVPTCSVDLQSAEEGEHSVLLSPSNVRIPGATGLEVLKINPPRISLTLERTISQQVTISVATRGEPAAGFEVYKKSSIPSSIMVTGARSHIERIHEIATESISLIGQKQSMRVFANLNIRDNLVRTMPVGPFEVSIDLGVRRKSVTIAHVPIQFDSDAFITIPRRVSVELLVPINYRGELSAADISAVVILSGSVFAALPDKIRPLVSFSRKLDPSIIIKEVKPSEVILRQRAN
jgi:YbbR domain-containing protein